jgi:hypothetical protein
MHVEMAQSILPQPTRLDAPQRHPTILTYLVGFEVLTADVLTVPSSGILLDVSEEYVAPIFRVKQ